MKVLAYTVGLLLFLVIFITGRGVYVYTFKHKIDERFTISYSQEGYRLIDAHQKPDSIPSSDSSIIWSLFVKNLMPLGRNIVSSPIIWYCVTKDHIIGCVGENISDKPESFIPQCQENGHFFVNKKDGNTSKNLGSEAIEASLKKNNAICNRVNIY